MDYASPNNDRHLSVYKIVSQTSLMVSIGASDSSAPHTVYQFVRVGGDYLYFSGGNTTSTAVAINNGFWLGTGTINRVLYRNGTSVGTSSNGSDTTNAGQWPFFVFGQNNAGSVGNTSNERQGGYSIGAAMTATQAADYYTAMQAFQTALGRNV